MADETQAATMTPPAQPDNNSASWESAAQPSQPATPTPQPSAAQQTLQTAAQPDRSQIQPETANPIAQVAYIPMPMRPVNTGLRGIIDKIGDVLAGTTTPEIYEDPQGNKYVLNKEMSHGQQWQKIAGEALAGAANGLAAGQGPGGRARAAAAGIQTGFQMHQQGQQEADKMNAQVRQDMMDKANAQMMRMQLAEQAWKLSRLQPEADAASAKAADAQRQKYAEQKGQMVGTMEHAYDLANVLHSTPDLAEQLVKKGTINLVPHYAQDEHGNYQLKGVEIWKMPDGWRNEVLPAKSTFDWFNPQTGQVEQHQSSDPMTAGEQSDYHTQAFAAKTKYDADKAENALKTAQTENAKSEINERTQKLPSEIRRNNAEASAAEARATKDRAETADESTIDQIGRGQINVGRLSYLLARNPEMMRQVTAKYPDFDSSKVENYLKVVEDFGSGKKGSTGYALNAGATALKHMQELKDMNTVKSHIPGTADWNAYHNKVDTLATELATFYGTPTIPAIHSIQKSLGSNLPGTRDAAINTQAQSMSDKFDSYEKQWYNAAPSKYYVRPMPQIDEHAEAARRALDPNYAARAQSATPSSANRTVPQSNVNPQIHAFSKSAWLRANPRGDINAAVQAAQKQNLQVVD